MAAKSKSMWSRVKQAATSFWNAGKKQVAEVAANPRNKIVSWLHKYVPTIMIVTSGLNAGATANKNFKDTLKAPDAKEIKADSKSMELATDGFYHYKNLHLDTRNLRPEMLNMKYMTDNKFDAVYAPRGKAATIENATGFGPYLTRMDDLRKFITKYRHKYKMLYEVMTTRGMNDKVFVNAWNKCNQEELIKDLDIEKWNNEYQPLFNRLSQKLGFERVTYETRGNENVFGYVASVMSCHGQSSQTFEIYEKAKTRAEKKFGAKVTLDNIVDESYDVRHELYGLKKRYFGNANTVGEKEANQIMRELVRQTKKTYTPVVNKFAGFKQYIMSQDISPDELIHDKDAIQTFAKDTTYWENQEQVQEKSQEMQQANNPYMAMPILELETQYGVMQKEMEACQKKIDEISSGKYAIMGRVINVDYGNFTAPYVSYLYESACDPTMKDKANTAIGLPQYNLSNTAKNLVNYLAGEYPELYNAMKTYGIRSGQFASVWNKLSTGPGRPRFESRQFDFMWKSFYNSWFKTLHNELNMPEVTKEMVFDKNNENWVYIASVISVGHQRPASVLPFARKAFNRVAADMKTNKPNPNTIGLVMYDVRDETWAKRYNKKTGKWTIKSRAMHRRYKGGEGVIGEKTLCENKMRYDRESPRLFAHMQEILNTMKGMELALEQRNNERVMLAAQQEEERKAVAAKKTQTIAQADSKTLKEETKQKVFNKKELFRARQRAQNNLARLANRRASTNTVKHTGNPQKTNTGNSRRA